MFVEETVITRTYPIFIILKLRSNNSLNYKIYKSVCRHSIILPQNSRPLLILLLSETTSMGDIMQVVEASKMSPKPKQLSGFVSIRKYCIIKVLQLLVANNLLFENIQINHRLLET